MNRCGFAYIAAAPLRRETRLAPPFRRGGWFVRALIETRRSPPFVRPADDLAGLEMDNPPSALFAHKDVACRQRAASKFFFAQH